MPQNTLTAGLSRYQVSKSDLDLIQSTFRLVGKDVHLLLRGTPSSSSQFAATRKEGLYFFILNLNGAKFKIYLGRTNSLSRRIREYTSEFQPHSPNDFKLQAFQSYLFEVLPAATLDLFFKPLPGPGIKKAEAEAIKYYFPLLNELITPEYEVRQALQKAFSCYVRHRIQATLKSNRLA